MSFRLILIHFMYRVIFGVGIAALMWVGGHLIYANVYQVYAMSSFRKLPDIKQRPITTGLPEIYLSPIPQRISSGMHADAFRRDSFARQLRSIQVGDEIQVSTPEGILGYFVTTVEIVPTESGALKSSGPSELTITTTSPFPFVGATPQRFIVHARPQSELKN